MINQPEILLADEPTSDLDERTELEIMSLLRDIHEAGVSFVIVTHSLQLLPYATKAFKMEKSTLGLLDGINETVDGLVSKGYQICSNS